MEKFADTALTNRTLPHMRLLLPQTGWLKTHYPAEFMAATMSSDMDKTDKVVTFIDECRSMELELLPPDVNEVVINLV